MNVTDGVMVTNTITLDTTGKILTITPSANLVVQKTYQIVVQGVKDVYGQSLGTQLIRFTTVDA